MNDKIKAILKKHELADLGNNMTKNLNNAIIEICEEQKLESANEVYYESDKKAILNQKNIAQ